MAILRAKCWDDGVVDDGTNGSTGSGAITIDTVTTPLRGSNSRVLRLDSLVINTLRYSVPLDSMTAGWLYIALQTTNIVDRTIFQLRNGSTVHLDFVQRASDGKIDIKRGAGGTTIATTTTAMTANNWLFVALKLAIDDTTGLVHVRCNGATTNEVTFSGDTKNGGTAPIDNIYWEWSAIATTLYCSCIVQQDATGSVPENDWLKEIEAFAPTADGTDTAGSWTAGGSAPAATLHESVDEAPSDDGVTLAQSNVLNDEMILTFANISTAGGDVYAVCPTVRAQKASAGTREITLGVKLAATTGYGSAKTLAAGAWGRFQSVLHRDPSGATWTETSVNASKGPIKVTT